MQQCTAFILISASFKIRTVSILTIGHSLLHPYIDFDLFIQNTRSVTLVANILQTEMAEQMSQYTHKDANNENKYN